MMDAEPVLPESIGPYRISGRLGAGGMGEVLRGYDDRLGRPVALKRILPDAEGTEKARERFRREARAVARLSHPAIVQVHDWVESEAGDWLVMELVDGRTLDELLADGPLPPARAAKIAREVASGLAAAHEAGLVHRDLKAANVIVTASGVVKILDFGVAKAVGVDRNDAVKTELKTTLTGEGQVVGTVTAMSPEQALGRPVDHRSDLFSLGTLLYEMLSGTSPFEGDTPVETLTRICTAKEVPLHRLDPEISVELSRLVGHLLEKERAHRPADARQVVQELDRLSGVAPDAPAVAELPASGSQEATLFEEAREVADPGASLAPKAAARWRAALAGAGVLIVVGLWGSLSWHRPPVGQAPDDGAGAPDSAARPPDQEADLGSHAFYERGMAYLERYDRKGNIDKAIADFQRALAQDGDSAPAYAGLARAYWLDARSGSKDPVRLDQARSAAERAASLDEHLALARVGLGLANSELGRRAEAVRDFETALVLEPLNADAHFGLGYVYESEGKLREAEAQYRSALRSRPDRWEHYAFLGALYLRSGRYEEAEETFLRSVALVPDNFLTLRNLGVAYYMQGELDQAATQFQRALQIQAEPSVYTNLGTIFFAQGLYARSVSAFEKAIEVGGGSNSYLLWGNLGDAYRWTPDNGAQAREAYLRAIQLLKEESDATTDVTLQTRLALYLAKRGDFDHALEQVGSIVGPPSDDASSWLRLAVVEEICGRRKEALAALESALQAGMSLSEVQRDPELLKLRQDVRYHRLVMRIRPAGGA